MWFSDLHFLTTSALCLTTDVYLPVAFYFSSPGINSLNTVSLLWLTQSQLKFFFLQVVPTIYLTVPNIHVLHHFNYMYCNFCFVMM